MLHWLAHHDYNDCVRLYFLSNQVFLHYNRGIQDNNNVRDPDLNSPAKNQIPDSLRTQQSLHPPMTIFQLLPSNILHF